MPTDEQLLQRYFQSADPAAFRQLVERNAGMVLQVGLRITGDRHLAEDVCQESFLALARGAGTLASNVAGWLHATATNRALNVIRSTKRRIQREAVGSVPDSSPAAASLSQIEWRELEAHIDDALHALPEELRVPLILHYLQEETQTEVADRLQIDQATVSRRVQRGLEEVRARLRRLGVMATVGSVTMALSAGRADAAELSAERLATLSKVAIGGIGASVASSASTVLGSLKSAVWAVGVSAAHVLAYLVMDGWLLVLLLLLEMWLLIRRPDWFVQILRSLSCDAGFGSSRRWEDHPLYAFRRWTFTELPQDWLLWMFSWAFLAAIVAGQTYSAAIAPDPVWGRVFALGLLAAGTCFQMVRLLWHAVRCGGRLQQPTQGQDPLKALSSWTAIGGALLCCLIGTVWLLLLPAPEMDAGESESMVLLLFPFVLLTLAIVAALNRKFRHPGAAAGEGDANLGVGKGLFVAIAIGITLAFLFGQNLPGPDQPVLSLLRMAAFPIVTGTFAIVGIVVRMRRRAGSGTAADDPDHVEGSHKRPDPDDGTAAAEQAWPHLTVAGGLLCLNLLLLLSPVMWAISWIPGGRNQSLHIRLLLIGASLALLLSTFAIHHIWRHRDDLPRWLFPGLFSLACLQGAVSFGLTAMGVVLRISQ